MCYIIRKNNNDVVVYFFFTTTIQQPKKECTFFFLCIMVSLLRHQLIAKKHGTQQHSKTMNVFLNTLNTEQSMCFDDRYLIRILISLDPRYVPMPPYPSTWK